MENIVATLINRAESHPDRLLIDAPDGALSYAAFFKRSLSIAERISMRGVQRGERVAIVAKDYASCLTSIFGCWLSGTVAVPLNLSLSGEVMRELMQEADVKLLVQQGGDAGPHNEIETLKYVELPSRSFTKDPLVAMQASEDALILFTSGTTGKNKGACLSLGALSYNALLAGTALKLSKDDRIFVNTPPYYTSGLSHFLTMLTVGGSIVARNGFYFGEALVEMMDRFLCTGFGGAPTHLMRVVETLPDGGMPERVRFWVSSGDHLPVSVIRKAAKRFPHLEIFTVYGLTEVGGRLCVLDPKFLPEKAGSVGKPVTGMSLSIRTQTGGEAKTREIGEVIVKGPLLMRNYLGQKESEREFATGDFGYFDEDGFLWLKGRRDDLFKSGGEKVSCIQIQQAILQTGMVYDAVVLASSDAHLGKVPHAYLVPTSRYNEDALRQLLRSELAPHQFPKKFILVDAIPRTGSGKVRKAELESEAPQEAAI
ncbi:MAG: acyl--CoA ligase [Bdellovibrionales bacterium]|nr:acyl--CoA ligase [Bdellovibrionales bacterium]